MTETMKLEGEKDRQREAVARHAERKSLSEL